MNAEKLKKIIDKHSAWLRGEIGGERGNLHMADLTGTDLSGANLTGADLYRADLSGADLAGANLCRANLYMANLSGANLTGADLYRADLTGTDLSGANLTGADLYRADLSGADLAGANLCRANLYMANLTGANLTGADLAGADLSKANLCRANLYRADLAGTEIEMGLLNKFLPICCPESGRFTAWKKARDGFIVKLEVSETAKRSSAYGRKCRCSEAKVLAIENADGTAADTQEVRSKHDPSFVYKVGEIVRVEDFDDDRRNECAPGIHFFITRQEAVDY